MRRANGSMLLHEPTRAFTPSVVMPGRDPVTDHSHRFEPYKRLHRLMRGRYHMLMPAMLIALFIGAIKGWRSEAPLFRSEGLIHVANSLPTVITQTDQNQPLQMYEEFIESQVLLMESRHVTEVAVANPDFRVVAGDMSVEAFASQLVIEHPPRTEAIDVSYTSRSPDVAAQGVKAVVAAFLDNYGRSDNTDEQRRLDVLTDRRSSLTTQIDAIKTNVAAIKPPSATSIAIVDDLMRDLFKQRSVLDAQVMSLQAAGYGSSFPLLATTHAQLDELRRKIEDYRTDFASMQVATVASAPQDRRVPLLADYLPYAQQMDELRSELEETNHRIDALQTEASLGAERFRVLSNGEVPSAPYADRRARVAGIYGFGAACIPLGIFMLMGLFDRRLRFSDDADEVLTEVPLLGVLPILPDGNAEPELAKIAAYCVHNLRIRLQLLVPAKSHGTFMITSAAPGEGKTSLTLALGLSFASSGKRVLLIDSDMVGRGLTHRLHRQGAAGLAESLDGRKLVPTQTMVANLSLLPVGRVSDAREEYGFTVEEIKDLLDEAAASFDIILVDSGPALATLHTPVIAQVVDHVILTIASGQQQELVQRSITMLRSVGIKVSGFVFNRARQRDYQGWIGGESYKSASSSASRRQLFESSNGEPVYGPLAGSVMKREAELANGEWR